MADNAPNKDVHVCHSSFASPLSQNMAEMDFERGIWQAALNGNVEKLEGHLNSGTPPDKRDPSGYTALVGKSY